MTEQIKKDNLLALNIKKAEKLFYDEGVDFPKRKRFISYDDSIAYTLANVNYLSKNILTAYGRNRFRNYIENNIARNGITAVNKKAEK